MAPIDNSNFYSLEDKSTGEKLWRYLTGKIILSTDSSEEVMRKVPCLVFGGSFFFGFCGVYYSYVASQSEVGSPEWRALTATSVALMIWGFAVALPTLIYVVIKKEAPIWITMWILFSTTILALIVDTFVTFFYANIVYLALSVFSMMAQLPYAEYHAGIHVILVSLNAARDSFYDFALRVGHPTPYEGTQAERMVFKMAAFNIMVMIPLAIQVATWEQKKLLAAAKFNVGVAQEVATHVLAYDCEKITDTLNAVSADVVVDEETNETERSIVSAELISAFRNINANLEIWKPLLPEWCLPKDDQDIETSIELYAGNTRDDDDDEEMADAINSNNSTHKSRNSRTGTNVRISLNSNKSHNSDSGGGVQITKKNLNAHAPPQTSASRFKAVDKRSWEGGSDNSGSENGENVKIAVASPQNTILKGSFHHRVIVCRLNLARLPPFLISAYQLRFKAARRFLPNTSARFNRIMEILLDTANNENATVHSLFSDHVYVSFNATSKAAHSELKAMRFLTTLETQIKKEVQKFAKDLEKENTLLEDFGASVINHDSNTACDDNTTTATRKPSLTPLLTESSILEFLNDSTTQHRLISGAAVSGSCFGQVAGNMKRQQFVLSTFSNQQTFEQACAAGDRGGFVVVCKGIHQSTQQEYEFRGCSCVVPEKYKALVEAGSVLQTILSGGFNHNNSSLLTVPHCESSNNQHQSSVSAIAAHHHQSNDIIANSYNNNNLHSPTEANNNSTNNNNVSTNQQTLTPQQQQEASENTRKDGGGAPETTFTPEISPSTAPLNISEQYNNSFGNFVVTPLYELVGVKKTCGGGDDEWMYLASDRGQTDNNGASKKGGVLLGQRLNDAVLYLCASQCNHASNCLDRMEKSNEEVAGLESFKMLKSMVPVIERIASLEGSSGAPAM